MKVWKLLGVAGLAGVAATGAIIARDERARRATTPEQVRERLHARYAASRSTSPGLSGEVALTQEDQRKPGSMARTGHLWRLARAARGRHS